MLLSCHSWTPFAIKIIREIQLRNNNFFVLIYGFIIEEVEWLKKYFDDLSKMDRESDSFRYPFHIVWELDEWELEGKFVIKRIFNEQTHIDLIKFANKFEAAYEIIKKWYYKETDNAVEWRGLEPIFIETGGYCKYR